MEARTIIEKVFATHEKVCVLFSGGMDSLLVLYLAKQTGRDFDVVTFSADWKKEDLRKLENLISEWDLTLYSFPPQSRFFISKGEEVSLIDEYGIAGASVPLVRDFEKDSGAGCAFELSSERYAGFSLGWTAVLTGLLESDRHYAFGNTRFSADTPLGQARLISPLFNQSKAEVEAAVKGFGLSKYIIENTGELDICSKCLSKRAFCPKEQRMVEKFNWNGAEMLRTFQQKYGFEAN